MLRPGKPHNDRKCMCSIVILYTIMNAVVSATELSFMSDKYFYDKETNRRVIFMS